MDDICNDITIEDMRDLFIERKIIQLIWIAACPKIFDSEWLLWIPYKSMGNPCGSDCNSTLGIRAGLLSPATALADRGIDWYRVSARDWSNFCAILWFAFFFIYFVTFVHCHHVLKYHILLEFIGQCISSIGKMAVLVLDFGT